MTGAVAGRRGSVRGRSAGAVVLWAVLVLDLVVFATVVALGGEAAQERVWPALEGVGLLAVVLTLRRTGRPARSDLAVAAAMGVLVWLAYVPLMLVSAAQVTSSVSTAAAVLAVRGAARTCPTAYPGLCRPPAVRGIALGVLVGVVLGAVNIALSVASGQAWAPGLRWAAPVVAVAPGVFEETVGRGAFLALAVSALGGGPSSRSSRVATWLLLVVPHAVVHTVPAWQHGAVIPAVVQLVLLSLLFGLPFAVLQRRHDLVSAMTAHWATDALRFVCVGLPG